MSRFGVLVVAVAIIAVTIFIRFVTNNDPAPD